MKNKQFDCVEMKRQGAEALQKQLAGMTPEQEMEFWQHRNEEFKQKQEQLRAKSKAVAKYSS